VRHEAEQKWRDIEGADDGQRDEPCRRRCGLILPEERCHARLSVSNAQASCWLLAAER
jgi:hypothetical protein